MEEKISTALMEHIRELSDRYETADFLKNDPSKFMHRFDEIRDAECAAFLAANLAFGRRDQILKHVEAILEVAGKKFSEWILRGEYKNFFEESDRSFYRMYTHNQMLQFFGTLRRILEENEDIGGYFQKKWQENQKIEFGKSENGPEKYIHFLIAKEFPAECALLPHSRESAAKKVNMMLRWLVRTGSPVDLGIWSWYDRKKLLLPLDTHVLQSAAQLGMMKSDGKKIKSANLRTAEKLTEICALVFPDDPVKADFALFGSGVGSGVE